MADKSPCVQLLWDPFGVTADDKTTGRRAPPPRRRARLWRLLWSWRGGRGRPRGHSRFRRIELGIPAGHVADAVHHRRRRGYRNADLEHPVLLTGDGLDRNPRGTRDPWRFRRVEEPGSGWMRGPPLDEHPWMVITPDGEWHGSPPHAWAYNAEGEGRERFAEWARHAAELADRHPDCR